MRGRVGDGRQKTVVHTLARRPRLVLELLVQEGLLGGDLLVRVPRKEAAQEIVAGARVHLWPAPAPLEDVWGQAPLVLP